MVFEDRPPTPCPACSAASKCAIQSYDVEHIQYREGLHLAHVCLTRMDIHMHTCLYIHQNTYSCA